MKHIDNAAGVRLLAIDDELIQSFDAGIESFEARYQVRVRNSAEFACNVLRQTAAFLRAAPRDARWGAYLAVDASESSDVVGTCAFKSGPNPDGTIEIAYCTFPDFEQRGYATAMALALLQRTEGCTAVRRVIAHTLPERNASTRVLEKVGMIQVGDALDADAGRVWRWERKP